MHAIILTARIIARTPSGAILPQEKNTDLLGKMWPRMDKNTVMVYHPYQGKIDEISFKLATLQPKKDAFVDFGSQNDI